MHTVMLSNLCQMEMDSLMMDAYTCEVCSSEDNRAVMRQTLISLIVLNLISQSSFIFED